MPFDRQHHEEMERRQSRFRDSTVALMNDTKWREVFSLITEHELGIQVKWISGNPEWNSESIHRVRGEWIETDGVRDPGIGGGPFKFRDLLWIRVPRSNTRTEKRPGNAIRSFEKPQNLDGLLTGLSSLGTLPLFQADNHIEIRGYPSPE